VTIILDFKFAVFDREKDGEELTAKNTKNAEKKTFALCSLRSLWLTVLTWISSGQSDQFWPKSHPCKPLMVKAVKPVSNQVKPLGGGSQGCGWTTGLPGRGSGKRWHPRWNYLNLGARYSHILSDKFTYCHLWSDISENNFFTPGPFRGITTLGRTADGFKLSLNNPAISAKVPVRFANGVGSTFAAKPK